MSRARRVSVAVGLFLGALATTADAQQKAKGLHIEAAPLLGTGSPAVDGWSSTLVRLENSDSAPISGTLDLVSRVGWGRSTQSEGTTRAPFSVPAKGRVVLQLPAQSVGGAPPELKVRAFDGSGRLLAEAQVGEQRPPDPLLLDLSVPSRTAPALRSLSIVLRHGSYGNYSTPLLNVTSPHLNPATGDPILPDLSAGYTSADVVLASGRQLATLEPPQTQALADWVLAGGTLALSLDRPEDLRSPLIERLVGGPPVSASPPAELGKEAVFVLPSDSMLPGPPLNGPRVRGSLARRRIAPSSESRDKLVGFSGGNLHDSPFGATASYGLGEVHLLPFQPNAEPFVNDPWVHHKLADLVRHAAERRATIALRHGEGLPDTRLNAIRRNLDPNEGTRWTVIVSALLLLLYAALAGPLNFHLASRRGRPLRALVYLPLWAGGALGAIVLLGTLGRGVEGRARRLTLIETGAGMSRASATRFRGLYASSASELVVRASSHNAVLDVHGDAEETGRVLVVDRDGARLEGLRAQPWEVVMVREDGFVDIGGGVSLVRDQDGSIAVKNRTARDLVGALLMVPGENAVYFRRIKDGERVSARSGEVIYGTRPTYGFGSPNAALGSGNFRSRLDADVAGLGSAWAALEASVGASVDWWPAQAPVLIAQLDGGEGKTVDSGLEVDQDRVLIRVVGHGGVL